MRYIVLAALLAAVPAGATVQHATGSFEVKMVPQASDTVDGLAMARMGLTKTFTGALEATSSGEMQTAMGTVEGSAAYVLLERVSGKLGGKTGAFVLMHSATLDRGTPGQSIVVVPDTGTGALAGLKGSMTIRIEGGKHFYDLAYEIVQRP